jgi:dTDP-4-dehydrorhamnose 3,5-epimerase-like enzyme
LVDYQLLTLKTIGDSRGFLTSIESEGLLSFDIKRVFYVYGVAEGAERGGHAHRNTDQLLVALNGAIEIVLSDGLGDYVINLIDPGIGLLVPRMTWTLLAKFSQGSSLLVLASDNYDISQSIREWHDYLSAQNLPVRPPPRLDLCIRGESSIRSFSK